VLSWPTPIGADGPTSSTTDSVSDIIRAGRVFLGTDCHPARTGRRIRQVLHVLTKIYERRARSCWFIFISPAGGIRHAITPAGVWSVWKARLTGEKCASCSSIRESLSDLIYHSSSTIRRMERRTRDDEHSLCIIRVRVRSASSPGSDRFTNQPVQQRATTRVTHFDGLP